MNNTVVSSGNCKRLFNVRCGQQIRDRYNCDSSTHMGVHWSG